MYKILLNEEGQREPRIPFWMPWGFGGCLWRTLVFLLTLLLMLFLLSKCGDTTDSVSVVDPLADGDKPFVGDPDAANGIPPVENTPIIGVPGTADGEGNNWLPEHSDGQASTPELPKDKDNQISNDENPIRSREGIPDDIPGEGVTVDGNHLNILISLHQTNNMESEMVAWAKSFKQNYPDASYSINYYNPNTGFMQITIPVEHRMQVKSEINRKMSDFDFIVFDEGIMGVQEKIPSDPAFGNLDYCWWHRAVQLYDAWEITMGDPNIIIGVVDSYFDLSHPEFRNKRIISPYCFERMASDPSNVYPPDGCDPIAAIHGTHVLSCAAAETDNGEGCCGVAPKCSIIPVSASTNNGAPSTLRLAEGILYCILHGADVVNVSAGLGMSDFVSLSESEQVRVSKGTGKDIERVMDYVYQVARKNNCMIVYAAGNDGVLAGLDPTKRNDNTIRVSACGYQLDSVGFTNYGRIPNEGINYSTVSFPGISIFGAIPKNQYACLDGTSMAAPLVTGVVALMKSIDSTLTNDEIIDILVETGKAQPEEQHIGPLVQIKDALNQIKNRKVRMADVLEDPTQLEGVWECKSELTMMDTNEPVTLYLDLKKGGNGRIFSKRSSGQLDEGTVHWSVNKNLFTVTIKSNGCIGCPKVAQMVQAVVFYGASTDDGTLVLDGHHENSENEVFTCSLRRRSHVSLYCNRCGNQIVL